MKRTIAITLLMLTIGLSAQTNGGKNSVTVTIENVKNTDGILMVTLFSKEADWLKRGDLKKVKISKEGTVKVTFENVSNGIYAVSVIHDENNNLDLDSNSFGIPNEPYGFSNNARGMFGPPSFEESQFNVSGDTSISLRVK